MVFENEVGGLLCLLGFLVGMAYMGLIWSAVNADVRKKEKQRKYMASLDDMEYRKYIEYHTR
jgi:hypothetical protein